jgi:serine/threonine-protein kinase RsbW
MKLLASSTFRREPTAVPTARAFVTRSLGPLALSVEASERLVLAAAEAFNNVVLHAEGDSFAVTVAADGSSCTVSVTDSGGGFRAPRSRPAMPPAYEVGRRGLALMYALVDRVEVISTTSGTAVVLAQALSAPATSAAGADGPARRLT